jgi:uncharacterized protein with FMN-binding domain
MRRAALALSGIVAGTTLLISLKSAPGASRTPAQVVADEASARKAAAIASASPGLPGLTGGPTPVTGGGAAGPGSVPGSGSAGGGTSGGTNAGQPDPKATSTKAPGGPGAPGAPAPKPTTKPPVVPAGTSQTFTGDSAYTEFGYVIVGITVSGGKLTDVTNVELPHNEPRSDQLSNRWGGELRQRALTAKSSKFDSVSGATYTSAAYKQSLQSALDKAGLG